MIRTTVGNYHYALMGAGEISEIASGNMRWMRHQEGIQGGNGAVRTEQFLELVRSGDESLVARSEATLAKIEDQIPVSRGWRNIDDVVGAVPNVPAFLAGHPQCMRRRERTMRDTAPLTIFMDLTSSMSISKEKILNRGITLLALVRLLIEHRSVELWVGSSLGDTIRGKVVTCTTGWRIDTAPMDLARAAFQIADTSMSRLFGYATCEMMVDQHLGGFGDRHDRNSEQLRQVAGWHEMLYIPPIFHSDPLVDDPVGWLKRTMAKYIKTEEEAA